MSSLHNEFTQRASVTGLEVLAKLLESDPETIASLSSKEIDEGLRLMDVYRKDVVPDAIKTLLSPGPAEPLFDREPRLHQRGGRSVLSAFVVFLMLAVVKFFRSRAKFVPTFAGFAIGWGVASLVAIGVYTVSGNPSPVGGNESLTQESVLQILAAHPDDSGGDRRATQSDPGPTSAFNLPRIDGTHACTTRGRIVSVSHKKVGEAVSQTEISTAGKKPVAPNTKQSAIHVVRYPFKEVADTSSWTSDGL